MLGCGDGGVLDRCFVLENAQRGEIVFHLLEGGQRGLAIGVDGFVVGGASLFVEAAALAAVEEQLGGRSG